MSSKILIPIPKKYDHSIEAEVQACGLDAKSFSERNKNLFKDFKADPDKNIVSLMAERIEQTFSKREMAFLMAAGQVRAFFATEKDNMIKENMKKDVVTKIKNKSN